MVNMRKYVTEVTNISREDALRNKEEDISYAKDRVKEAIRELSEIKSSPLVLQRIMQVEVLPDDPRWEEAGLVFFPGQYHGDWRWVTRRNL